MAVMIIDGGCKGVVDAFEHLIASLLTMINCLPMAGCAGGHVERTNASRVGVAHMHPTMPSRRSTVVEYAPITCATCPPSILPALCD